ncbi:MAG: hypothetical protein ACI88G_001488 [Woeseiaceae bacterium]|jgi:hypothetical protein
MIWQKLKLNWSNAIGELVIIVVGVLIALAIDQWNANRLERLEEVNAVSRIIIDLQTDLDDFAFRLESVSAKEQSLLRVKAALEQDIESEPVQFLTDIIVGSDIGWNQGFAQRSTYDNLMASGQLSIIQKADIRAKISSYYRLYEDEHIRIEERETGYPALSYQLVPRRGLEKLSDEITLERTLDPNLSERQLLDLVHLVRSSSISNQVTAELNLARFIREVELVLQWQAKNLVGELEGYLDQFE